jgi:hypothetical protein
LILKLRHIEAEQLSRAENLCRHHNDRFGFPNTRWTEQKKTPARATGLGESEFAAPHGGSDSW